MMFPHTVTIYHHSIVAGKDAYTFEIVSGAYWQYVNAVKLSGKGQMNGDGYAITFSPEATKDFGSRWTCTPNDKVIKGEGGAIASWKDLPEPVLTVARVEVNVCGSPVDNIVVVG